jgi:hypothetical protein
MRDGCLSAFMTFLTKKHVEIYTINAKAVLVVLDVGMDYSTKLEVIVNSAPGTT